MQLQIILPRFNFRPLKVTCMSRRWRETFGEQCPCSMLALFDTSQDRDNLTDIEEMRCVPKFS
jgi:hypothetical protein